MIYLLTSGHLYVMMSGYDLRAAKQSIAINQLAVQPLSKFLMQAHQLLTKSLWFASSGSATCSLRGLINSN